MLQSKTNQLISINPGANFARELVVHRFVFGCLWFYLSYTGTVNDPLFAYFGSTTLVKFSAIIKPIITLCFITPYRRSTIEFLRLCRKPISKVFTFSKFDWSSVSIEILQLLNGWRVCVAFYPGCTLYGSTGWNLEQKTNLSKYS